MQESNTVTNATQAQQETRLIHCYDVVQFVIEVEKAVEDGFSLDLVTPQNYPVQIGYQYIATMIKTVTQEKSPVKATVEPVEASEIDQVVQSTEEDVQEVVEAPKKAGRPAKGK